MRGQKVGSLEPGERTSISLGSKGHCDDVRSNRVVAVEAEGSIRSLECPVGIGARQAGRRDPRPCGAGVVVTPTREGQERAFGADQVAPADAAACEKQGDFGRVAKIVARLVDDGVALVVASELEQRFGKARAAGEQVRIHLDETQELLARFVVATRSKKDTAEVGPRRAKARIDLQGVSVVTGGHVGAPFALGQHAERMVRLRQIPVDAARALEMQARPREVAALHLDQAEVRERLNETRVVLEGECEASFGFFEVAGSQGVAPGPVELDGLGSQRSRARAGEANCSHGDLNGETHAPHAFSSASRSPGCSKPQVSPGGTRFFAGRDPCAMNRVAPLDPGWSKVRRRRPVMSGKSKGRYVTNQMNFLVSVRRTGVALAFCILASPGSAAADPSSAELASARSLFNEARAAEDRGDWNEALIKLDAVAKVKLTPQVRFHLGLCQEHLSLLLESLNNLERAASEGAEQNLSTVAEEAKEHAAAVRARLPKLFIALPSGTDAHVEVDGQVVASVLLTRPVAFDPGPHKIVATAPGLTFSREIAIAEREEKRIDVVFGPVAPVPGASAPLVAPGAPEASTGAGSDSGASNSGHRGSTLGWVAVGVGGAALVGATASLLVRQSAIDDIEQACPTHENCPRRLESSQSTARTFGALGAVLAVVGGASVATGVVLLLQPRSEPASAKVAVAPWMTASGAGATGVLSW